MSSSAITCPQCSATVPTHEGYTAWCEHCTWNLHGTTEPEPRSFLDTFYRSMSRRHSEALFRKVLRAGKVSPPATVSTVVAFALAAIIHLFTVAVAIASVWVLIAGWPNFYSILLGVCGLGFVWLARPRVTPVPTLLRRDEFPAIYELSDRVADALAAKKVDGICINGEYNAAFGRMGWKRKRILYLGLPLWEALCNEERIDLVAHELAHNINNDYRSSFFVGGAIATLHELHALLYPDRILPTEIGLWAFAAVPFTLTSLGLSHIVRWCALGMEQLLWSSSQRAEYYADLLAATISGKKASLGALDKLLLADLFHFEVRRMVMQRTKNDDLFAAFQKSAAAVPDREMERLRRAGGKMVNRMDISHPPVFLRMNMIEQLAPEQPSLLIEDELLDAVQQEMDSLKPEVQDIVIDEYRASIYD